MNILINSPNQVHQYQVFKRFHNHVPCLSDYLIKTVGVDSPDEKKKKECKKIKQGKIAGLSMRVSVYKHMLRSLKRKRNKKHYKKSKHEKSKSL